MLFDSTTAAYLLVLTVLLILIAAGVWRSRRSGRQLLSYALIWIAVFLLICVMYKWFNPLADVDLSGPKREI